MSAQPLISPASLSGACNSASVRQRILRIKEDIAAAREKERRLCASIQTRQATLNRLQTQLAICGESRAAHSDDGQ